MYRRRPSPYPTAFTLIELLIVATILGVLISLLLPAVQAAREYARQAACKNNLRQTGLALLEYEGVQRAFPAGSEVFTSKRFPPVSHGRSWWWRLLPHLEQQSLFQRLEAHGPAGETFLYYPYNASLVDGVSIASMVCPSSSLETMWPVNGYLVQMPSYVGVSGAARGDGFAEDRISECCTSYRPGALAAGGVLTANQAVALREITDGASNTLAVAECSASIVDSKGYDRRVDGGFAAGWYVGTKTIGTPPDFGTWFKEWAWNIVTVRYPPNTKTFDLPGIEDNHGANNPFTSSHPGGVYGVICDGSVRFISNDVEMLTLKGLATRDDGHSLSGL